MDRVDLNLLMALDVLLDECSVTRAARRLGLSTSAMSRTLLRLRSVTGDPLLVRAGRGLVPTPHATALRDRVRDVSRHAQTLLRPSSDPLDLATLESTFTLRANDAFIEFFSVPLLQAVTAAAPRVRLRFAPKPDKDAGPLREGRVDLEIGVVDAPTPEMRVDTLFVDHYVGVARSGHPLLHGRKITPKRYAACGHVASSPDDMWREAVDDALDALGLKRDVRIIVPGFTHAMRVARHSDLVALVPRSCLGHAPKGQSAVDSGLQAFDLPVPTPSFTVCALWHPRMDVDPAQQWFRDTVISVCRDAYPQGNAGIY
ncbi:LysR family transcriptional regulator [Oleiagrimonas soli]|uniref:DNA-binding transcriptional LysR family regulator n=1 Tax=Oleiagrimonas soli TaxID=1543381 RepID=A0A099CYI9_9GAMM|nr:LysR family transcriptional regulator [Oleiagrimonas soli]KGI78080.1 LysR family transcriptional regulator [Oleiagrimonas soli]MBB6183504.1 DNA-binding transcriptional LysR family regulator [Oleiagrimonas soli]